MQQQHPPPPLTANDYPDITTIRQTTSFQEHVARLLTPLKPGLEYVRTMGYAVNDFERNYADPDFLDILTLSPALLHRARLDAIRNVDFLELEIMDLIELDAIAYMKNPDPVNYAWNAKDPEELRVNLCGFCDCNIGIWEENHHPTYHASLASDPTLTEIERKALSEYVKSFVGCASAALPYHLEEGDEEIYYDSADTEEAMESDRDEISW